MGYVTQSGLVERFGEEEIIQLTDRTAVPPAAIDATVVERAIADASSMIDGYLARRYALPLTATPPALAKAAADIARYYLHGAAAGKDDAVSRAHEAALRWLRDIASGAVTLDADGAAQAPASTGARVSTSEPVLTRQSLKVLG